MSRPQPVLLAPLFTLAMLAGACDRSAETVAPPQTPSARVNAELSGDLPQAQLCCHGDTGMRLGGCLGPAALVGSVAAANACLTEGAQLLACEPDKGGWTCLPAKAGTPQLCTCGSSTDGAHATGIDAHTWSQRADAVYRAYASEEAEPRPLCCDEVDPQTGVCRWQVSMPWPPGSGLDDQGDADGEPDSAGANGKSKSKSKGKGKGKGKSGREKTRDAQPRMAMRVPSIGTPPRGPIQLAEVASCEASGGKIMGCPVRATSCEHDRTVLTANARTISGACTCEAR